MTIIVLCGLGILRHQTRTHTHTHRGARTRAPRICARADRWQGDNGIRIILGRPTSLFRRPKYTDTVYIPAPHRYVVSHDHVIRYRSAPHHYLLSVNQNLNTTHKLYRPTAHPFSPPEMLHTNCTDQLHIHLVNQKYTTHKLYRPTPHQFSQPEMLHTLYRPTRINLVDQKYYTQTVQTNSTSI